MDRRRYIEGLGAVVATGAIAGCTGNENGDDGNDDGGGDDGTTDSDDSEYGVLSTSVTDQPNDIADFESLVVTIEGIWVKPAGVDGDGSSESESSADGTGDDEPEGETVDGEAESEGEDDAEDDDVDDAGDDEESTEDGEGSPEENDAEDGDVDEGSGRYYIEFEEPQEADLVQLQGDESQLVDETELETGEYQFLQLNVSGTTGTLEDGEEAPVETPGNAPLQFKQAFEIRADERTRFIADFAPFRRGNGTYLIRPVASGTQVLYGDEEDQGGEEDDGSDEDDDGTDGETDSDDSGSGDSAGQGENGPE